MKILLITLPFAGLLACSAPQNNGVPSANKPATGFGGPRGGGVTWGQSTRAQAAIPPSPGKTLPAAAAPAATPAPQRKSLFAMLFGPKEVPRAKVVEAAPAPKPTQPTTTAAAPELPKQPNDGLRMPDMLTMPDKNEFQSTNPSAVKSQNPGGAVIARPPTDPPARQKTKESDP